MGSWASRVWGGILSSVVAGSLSMIVNLATIPMVLSAIGPSKYGVWLFVFAIAQVLFLSDLGVGTALTHYAARHRAGSLGIRLSSLCTGAIIWSSVSAVLSLLAGGWLMTGFLASSIGVVSNAEASALFWCGITAISSICIRPLTALAIGMGLLPLQRRMEASAAVVRLVVIYVICTTSPSVVAVAWAEALLLVAPTLAMAIALIGRRLVNWGTFREGLAGARFLFSYGWRSFLVNALGTLLLQGGSVLAGVLSTPADVAYYNSAYRVYSAVRTAIGWSVDPFRPALSKALVYADRRQREIVTPIVLLSFYVAAISVGALVLAAPQIVEVWLGSEYLGHRVDVAMQVLLVGVVLNSLHLPLIPCLDGAGHPGAFLGLHMIWLASFAALGLWLTWTMGIVGIAVALTAPAIVLEPLYLLTAARRLGFAVGEFWRRSILPVLLICLPSAACAYALVVIGGAFGMVMAPGILALGYLLCSGLLSLVARSRLSLPEIKAALRLEL